MSDYLLLRHRQFSKIGTLDGYLKQGGFSAFKRIVTENNPAAVIDEVKKSGLRGRGGAGFPTGVKWSFLPDSITPHYVVANADESEPGTFKDREIMESNPYQFLEGLMIACFAVKANLGYVYLRGEFWQVAGHLESCLAELRSRGYLGKKLFGNKYDLDLHTHLGAGAYICGEESSLMNSIEGKRGYPRVKPPFPAQFGLWGCPTTVNNVETIANVPPIISKGWQWFSKIGEPKHPGTILYGISGHVNKPGVYELPSGTLLTDLIYNYAGGVQGNKKILCVIPGGSSMPPLRGDQLEGIKMDAESLKAAGSAIGTGGVMVMDEDTDLVKVLARITKFYYHESCGQCTPCREGTGWMLKILNRILRDEGTVNDLDLLISVANNIEGNTICALGDAAAWPVKFMVMRFREYFEERVKKEMNLPVANKVHSMRNTAIPLSEIKN